MAKNPALAEAVVENNPKEKGQNNLKVKLSFTNLVFSKPIKVIFEHF